MAQLDLLPPRPIVSVDQLTHEALSDFVYAKPPREGDRGRMLLARRTTLALWLLLAAGLFACVELLAIIRSTTGCNGLACSVATFGAHPMVTLVLAALGTSTLVAAAAFTRGFTRTSGNAFWLTVPVGLTLASVAGLLAVLVATALVLVIAILAVTVCCAFFADHS
ncbi:hypothetical protein OHA70_15320 [Kribbella sp. NBC_00382]|uniref:hypothetical protein n=1 Tax=Kribbella sp. NBC_00382 TaxID=2975967 RepID=UPI002E1ADEDC